MNDFLLGCFQFYFPNLEAGNSIAGTADGFVLLLVQCYSKLMNRHGAALIRGERAQIYCTFESCRLVLIISRVIELLLIALWPASYKNMPTNSWYT